MKFVETDERPVARSGRAPRELTEFESDILDAFQISIRKNTGTDEKWVGKPMAAAEAITSEEQVINFQKAVQKAANLEGVGFRFRAPLSEDGTFKVVFWAVSLPPAVYAECPACHKDVGVTRENTLRTHGPKTDRCRMSGAEVSA